MGIVDISLMVLIIGGAFYLLYRSLWKKKGHCQGCDSGACDVKKKINSEDC
ncbi:MAG: FeoB-associated Cys-rich membrane protein [Nitrospirae bacterium]|nr:FeoB-associated Cys-rich membrane protein [Nitrospirota bacterium]